MLRMGCRPPTVPIEPVSSDVASSPPAPSHATEGPTVSTSDDRPARNDFKVLTRTRGGYDNGVMYDVQLQVTATGNLVWAQTFTDQQQADEFQAQVTDDLELDSADFRRKYSVPSTV